jgi:transcriptional regulator with PAS, ATPase and Fis domain
VRVTTGVVVDESGVVTGFVETVEDARNLKKSETELRALDGLPDVVGMSSRMQELLRLIPVVAQADSSVLLTGETGTGKDVFAEIIHNASSRAEYAFVKINCGALPENLLESELFGHKRGAFTGAVSDKMGRLRMADKGTVYLTEIGDLPLSLQVKLLTYLDDRIVHPLGSTSGFTTDVRVIAATHRDLERMVKEGEFREDLFFRLNVVRLGVPPLRDREGDVQLLLEHFRTLFASRFGKTVEGFSAHARQLLLGHPYPGNVRELRNIVEYATGVCTGGRITVEDLPRYLLSEEAEPAGRPAGDDARSVRTTAAGGSGNEGESSWANVERQLILDALTRARGRRGKAAESLGWARTTLWRKMKEHGL